MITDNDITCERRKYLLTNIPEGVIQWNLRPRGGDPVEPNGIISN